MAVFDIWKIQPTSRSIRNFCAIISTRVCRWMESQGNIILLDQVYNLVYHYTKILIKTSLGSGYGIIVFNVWLEQNGFTVVNILIHVKETINSVKFVFFLNSLYTGTKKDVCYMQEIENVLQKFGGPDRICVVTSDNTRSCKKSGELLAAKFCRMLIVNHQFHIADLLMKDLDKFLSWVSELVKLIMKVVNDMNSRPHLKEYFKKLMTKYNKNICERRKEICISCDLLEDVPLVWHRDS